MLEQAVAAGNVPAMNGMGWRLCDGGNGVKQDAHRGQKLLERAIAKGSEVAMYNLGKRNVSAVWL